MKWLFCVLLSSLFLINLALPTLAAEKKESVVKNEVELAPMAKSAILIERDTGTILYEKDADVELSPASMTKIMTMLLIMESLDKKQLSMSEKIRTSEYAASMGGSQIFLEPGEEMTVEQMLHGIAIGSANDASVAMAERIAGSEDQFVHLMNKKAKKLGLKHTHFKNATGLPSDDHYSSAHDMSIMAKELLKYKEITKFTSKYESYLRENTDKKFWLVNTNKLVKFYPGVDGLKTGFTQQAKYCLTATAKKGDMRVIAVVFGANNPKERNAQITKMLDYAFSQYKTQLMYKQGQELALIPVSKGSEKKVSLVTSEPVSLLTKKNETTGKIRPKIVLKKDVYAPIKKGEQLGTIQLIKDGQLLSKTNLIAAESVNKATWFDLYKRTFGMFTKSGRQ